jgi:hypothetical protein
MTSLSRRAPARRKIAAGVAVGLTLGAIAMVRTQTVHAATKSTPISLSCTILGSASTVTSTITTGYTPDPLHSGDTVVLTVETSPPSGVPLDVPVTNVGMTLPIPAQVDLTAPSSVVLSGGNLTGSASVSGSNLRIDMVGTGVTAFQMQIPKMTITSKLKSGIGGQTINWSGPSNLDITATVGGPLAVPCTSPAVTVATATVAADAPVTTVAPTTATTKPPTTVAPTTATTKPPTTVAPTTATTKAPTTVTTKPPTTVAPTTATTKAPTTVTTKPATTATTKPPTTKPPVTTPPTTRPPVSIPPFLQRLLCLLFHFGC